MEPKVETHHKAMIDIFLMLIIHASVLLVVIKQADVFIITVAGVLIGGL